MDIHGWLYWISWVGDIVGIVGLWYQSNLNMRKAFPWFIVADLLLIGIQVYAHIWSQVVLYLIYLCMSSKGLIKCILMDAKEELNASY